MIKKTITTFVILCLFISNGFSQAFKKYDVIFTGGLGGCFGMAIQNYSPNYQTYQYNDVAKPTVGVSFPVTAEFAIHDKWGIGLSFAQNSYINSYSDRTQINNFGLLGAFHLVSKERLEIYTRLNVGFSKSTFIEKTDSYYGYSSSNYTYTYDMKGGFAKPSFGFRIYFGKHIGLFADAGVGIYSLSGSQYNSSYDYRTYSLDKKVRLTMVGVEISAGVAFKL